MGRIGKAARQVSEKRAAAELAVVRARRGQLTLQERLAQVNPLWLIGGGLLAGVIAGRLLTPSSRAGHDGRRVPRSAGKGAMRWVTRVSSLVSTAAAVWSRVQAMTAAHAAAQAQRADRRAQDAAADANDAAEQAESTT